MIGILCRSRVFLVLSAVCLVMGRDAVDPGPVLTIIVAFVAIDWLLHHIPPRWARYLRNGLVVAGIAAVILVPELREIFVGIVTIIFSAFLSLTSPQLIALAIVFLVTHAVLCWSRPAVRANA